VAGDHIVLEQARFISEGGRFSVTGELDANRYVLHCRANSTWNSYNRSCGENSRKWEARSVWRRGCLEPRRSPWWPVLLPSLVQSVQCSGVSFTYHGAVGHGASPIGCGGTEGSGSGVGGATLVSVAGLPGRELRADHSGRAGPWGGEASLLESLVPDAVSDVSGSARIDAKVSGRWTSPMFGAHRSGRDPDALTRHQRPSGRRGAAPSSCRAASCSCAGQSAHQRRRRLLIGALGQVPAAFALSACARSWCWQVDLPLKGERLVYRAPASRLTIFPLPRADW